MAKISGFHKFAMQNNIVILRDSHDARLCYRRGCPENQWAKLLLTSTSRHIALDAVSGSGADDGIPAASLPLQLAACFLTNEANSDPSLL
jgi:hypothetical protein